VFSKDGRFVVTTSGDGLAWVWDARTGQQWTELRGHTHWVFSAAFHPTNSNFIVTTAMQDGTARVWYVGDQRDKGRTIFTLRGHANGVGPAVFSPVGTQILSGDFDGKGRLWQTDFGAAIPNAGSPVAGSEQCPAIS
jgi:WD40 repeat protein